MTHVMTYKELCDLDWFAKVYEEFKDKSKYKNPIQLINNGYDLTTGGRPWYDAEHYLLFQECAEDCSDYN